MFVTRELVFNMTDCAAADDTSEENANNTESNSERIEAQRMKVQP